MAKLLNIATRDASRAPMQMHDTAEVTQPAGITGDFRGKTQGRQVTVIVREAWEQACKHLGTEVPWTARRANLLIEGLDLHQTAGKHLHIGDVVLQITGETEPCSRMDEAHSGLQNALAPNWRAGVTCTVQTGGTLRVGNAVKLED